MPMNFIALLLSSMSKLSTLLQNHDITRFAYLWYLHYKSMF